MLAQRRNNELDNFIVSQLTQGNNQRMLSPMNHNHYHYSNAQNAERNDRNVSPNRIANTRRPMIAPIRSATSPVPAPQKQKQTNRDQFCSNENHRNKKAEYLIHIQDQDMYYCGICATQAASQGFTVNRIGTQKRQKTVPHIPSYAGNQRYQELTSLMRDILKLENEFKRRSPRSVEDHYRKQEQLLTDFYDNLVEIVEGLRQQHLTELKTQQAKSIAAGQMQYSHLELHMQDLNEAWEDIQETFQDVLEKIDPQSFEEGMRTYRNTLNVCKHKLEEFDDGLLPLTSIDSALLAQRLENAEESLLALWQEQPTQRRIQQKTRVNTPVSSNRPSQPTNIKNVHQGLPKAPSQSGQGQAAFRNLFPDDQSQERLPQASPQFKAF